MIINRLRLRDFKRHGQLDVALGAGLNIVRGPNEAGKSTVQRALEMALFRRPTFGSAELEDIQPWQGAQGEPTVELEFEEDGQHGTLKKVFAGQRGTVELEFGEQHLSDPAAAEALVAQLTGLPTEKFFRASASIHHQELNGLTADENTLRDRLQQSMSGADRGTHAARRKLEEAIRRYRTEGAKNPGYLKVMRAEVDRLRDAVMRGEAALSQLEADRRALAEARSARVEIDAKLDIQREGAAKAERAAALTTNAADAARRYALYKRAAELRAEIGKLEATHPSAIALPVLRTTVEHLRKLEFSLSEMRAELAAEPDLSSYDVALSVPRWRPWLLIGGVLSVAGLAIAGLGLAAGAGVIGLLVGGAVLGTALLAFFVAARLRRRLNDIRIQNELRESEIGRRLAGRTDLAERVRQAEQERSQALESLNSADLARAESILAAETEHSAKIGAWRAEYRGLMGDDPTGDDVGMLRDEAAAEADECRHTLAGMGEIGRDPGRFVAAFGLAIQRLAPERDAAFQNEAQADARVGANDIDAERVAGDSEALQAAQEAFAAAERRLRIYEDVLATLNGAERGTMKKAARYLEQRMAHDIERITGGRYRRLKVDEASLTFSVYSAERADWIDVRTLSQGTVDQLYLCARLGIVRQVTQPASPPLIFDDPFVTFDDERAQRALELLKDIAVEYQVIYLTTSERYDGLADNVVVLPAPDARDDQDESPAPANDEAISMWSSSSMPVEPPAAPAPVQLSGQSRNGQHEPGISEAASWPAEPAPLWPDEH